MKTPHFNKILLNMTQMFNAKNQKHQLEFHRLAALDVYLGIRWNGVLNFLKDENPEKMTNSQDKVYAKPPTCLRRNGRRDGEGVKFMESLIRHVSSHRFDSAGSVNLPLHFF